MASRLVIEVPVSRDFNYYLLADFKYSNELRPQREEVLKTTQEEGERVRGMACYPIRSWGRAVSHLDWNHKSELSHRRLGSCFCGGVYLGNPRATSLPQTQD